MPPIQNNSAPELFSEESLKKTRHIYTVSELTQDIKIILENTFSDVWIEGEVSGISRIPTGTVFFNLKDSSSLLKCVIFASYVNNIKFELKDGIKVVCFGRVSVYEKQGNYQLYVQKIEPQGIGSLQLALEQLKQKLEKQGLFSPEHKRPIPYLPSRIGVVTSLQGAAIKDILKVLERRFKDIHIIVNPVRVQGEGAKDEIAQAIKDFNSFNASLPLSERIEVMIVGRGGGSIEDLWAFNEEAVAYAIYDSKIPIISAVGHERDVTIADLVADLRTSTPSSAAEMVIPLKEDLKLKLGELFEELSNAFGDILTGFQERVDEFARRLINPINLIQQYRLRTLDLARQIYVRIGHFVKLKEAGFLRAAEKLSSLSPLSILSRGYSITFKMPEETIIKDINELKAEDIIRTRLHKGEILSKVTEIKP
jgi:exodeoxyribonuclease VII large subunit